MDLDVLVRDDLLKFLKKDSDERGATILCESSLLFKVEQMLTIINGLQQMQHISSTA